MFEKKPKSVDGICSHFLFSIAVLPLDLLVFFPFLKRGQEAIRDHFLVLFFSSDSYLVILTFLLRFKEFVSKVLRKVRGKSAEVAD